MKLPISKNNIKLLNDSEKGLGKSKTYQKIKVTPNSSKTEIKEIKDNIIKINLNAPPEKDKANKELIKFFKKQFKLNVRIKKGKTSREKILEII